MRVLFLEPFFGGSHRELAEGFAEHSSHSVDLLTLPARFWKWRMRGAALHFFKRIPEPRRYDAFVASSLMSLADLKALLGPEAPPCLVYFHENQLDYPLAPGERMDFQFGFTNITTCLAADRVAFNSAFHRRSFLEALPPFLKMMPDCRPKWIVDRIRNKSEVLHPGCRFPGGPAKRPLRSDLAPPLVVWCHRWEHDKRPEVFFRVLERVEAQGVDFRLALLGESFQRRPEAFSKGIERFRDRIVRCGFEPRRERYLGWLKRGRVVVSTAVQENFGMAVVEAVRCGCLPLLPDRLAYPEVIPQRYHDTCLYGAEDELVAKLAAMLSEPARYNAVCNDLAEIMGEYAWEKRIGSYDAAVEALVADKSLP